MLLAVRTSSYGCTWEVWRALTKLELVSAAPRATLTFLSCSPNFPRACIHKGRFTRYDFVAYDKLTTGLRHELFRVNQTYNSLNGPKSCRRPVVSMNQLLNNSHHDSTPMKTLELHYPMHQVLIIRIKKRRSRNALCLIFKGDSKSVLSTLEGLFTLLFCLTKSNISQLLT